tara:strand:+ start:108 stop:374 length:267 start_codon:yes stop_codon:yes gene_type:complete
MRARTFWKKDLETLNWIHSFGANKKLLDIGAKIRIYYLYTASKGINVISIEPSALNYELLNLNIKIYRFRKRILPYYIVIHKEIYFQN